VRCIFGSPFRPPVSFGSAVLAHNGGAAVKLATVIYEDRSLPSGELDSVRLAILADALEEAGVDDAAALQHLRGPGPHCRGCNVVAGSYLQYSGCGARRARSPHSAGTAVTQPAVTSSRA
jgi:hypothetical protein